MCRSPRQWTLTLTAAAAAPAEEPVEAVDAVATRGSARIVASSCAGVFAAPSQAASAPAASSAAA